METLNLTDPSILLMEPANVTNPFPVLLLVFGAGIVVRSLYAIKRWQDLGLWALGWFFISYSRQNL